MPTKRTKEPVLLGDRVREARKRKRMSVGGLAEAVGQEKTVIESIESGASIPPVGILLQVARALRIDTDALLLAQPSKRSDRQRAYSKRTGDYAYKTLTPGAEGKHLWAFEVTVDPEREHAGVGYHHEGEEFIYLLEGKIAVTVGEKRTELGKGDAVHFDSGIKHQIRNLRKKKARFLVVIYGP